MVDECVHDQPQNYSSVFLSLRGGLNVIAEICGHR